MYTFLLNVSSLPLYQLLFDVRDIGENEREEERESVTSTNDTAIDSDE